MDNNGIATVVICTLWLTGSLGVIWVLERLADWLFPNEGNDW